MKTAGTSVTCTLSQQEISPDAYQRVKHKGTGGFGMREGDARPIDDLIRTRLCAEDQHMGLCNNHKMPEETCCETKSGIKK